MSDPADGATTGDERARSTATPNAAPGSAWLFVPGNRPQLFEKAAASGADAVIVDLEDAVSPHEKEDARELVAGWLASGHSAYVRVNARATPWHRDDVERLARLPSLQGVMLPKIESPRDVEVAHALLQGVPLLALIESATALLDLPPIAAAEGVARLALGSVDLASDLGVDEDSESLDVAGSMLVFASRAAGLPAPIAGVTRRVDDLAALRRDTERAKRLGFGAKLCIHPGQLALVRDVFTPSETEYRDALALLAAMEGGANAQRLDGQMVDAAVIGRARRIIADYKAAASRPAGNPPHN